MTRTAAREIAIQLIYGLASNDESPEVFLDAFFETGHYATLGAEDRLFESAPGGDELDYIRRLVTGVFGKRAELDLYIEKYAKNWRVSRISKTATAIMRAAMYEILYMGDIPDASAIDEAVELSKGYEERETVAFINGVLGGFVRAEKTEYAAAETFVRAEKAERAAAESAGCSDKEENTIQENGICSDINGGEGSVGQRE